MSESAAYDRPWEIWLVHHTHVDIGYTEPQEVILRKHAEFIARALDCCTASDSLPLGERFCWTCETSWTVKAFLARYPERAEEFFRRAREGRIEITALYLQLTDLYTLALLERTTDYALALGRSHGFQVLTAMNDDVNGWPWGLPDLLAARGVRYMDTGINETRSLGVRPRPALFEWAGSQGGSVLLWHSNGYLFGNSLGLRHPENPQRIREYLLGLQQADYPYHIIEAHIGGAAHDNAPPGLWLCEMIRRWNALVAVPKLRLVTPRTWFEEAAAHWPAPVTRHQAGWPDWWADGNGTAAFESALARRAQADLSILPELLTATGAELALDRIERAWDAAAFFCEHTWGAWNSTDEPGSLEARAQWNAKAGYAYTAAVESTSLIADALAVGVERYVDWAPGVLVYNPGCAQRSAPVDVLVSDIQAGLGVPTWVPGPRREEQGPALYLVDAVTGAEIPVVREPVICNSARHPGQRLRFVAADLPAHGLRAYRIQPGEAATSSSCRADAQGLHGPHLALALAQDGAGIRSLRTVDGRELLNPTEFVLGEVVYERIAGPNSREKLCGWSGIRRDCPLKHTRLRWGRPQAIELPYGAALRLRAEELVGSLRALSLEAIIYDALPCLDLAFRLEKYPEQEAESLFVVFPLVSGTLWLDTPGAWLRPGIDQVPGTATDWHSLQRGFAVMSAQGGVAVASPDIPLVQVGGINTGKWQEVLPDPNGLVMSWVFNNYWFTNFPAAQGGVLEWHYSLTALPAGEPFAEAQAALEASRQPLRAVVIPARGEE